MTQKQNPTAKGRVLWTSFVGASTESTTALALQAQILIAAHHVRPELAALVASLAFDGGAHV